MRFSLRWKLFFGLALIISLAVGTVTFIATRTVTKEFDRYITQDQALRYQRLALVLSSFYEQTGSWNGVQKLIDRVERTYQGRMVLANATGEVMGDTSEKLLGHELEGNWSLKIATLHEGEERVGTLYLKNRNKTPIEETFLESVNKSVLFGAIISSLAGLMFMIFYSRLILKPINDLTTASEKITRGQLNQKVTVNTNDEIGKLASTFNSMAEKLKKQKRLRNNMVNDIAHELRNPLSKSHGYLEALKEGKLEPNKRIIETLYRNSSLLKRLVTDLQDLAKAEAGKLQLEKQEVLLQDVIKKALQATKAKLKEHSISTKTELGPEILIRVDPDRLEQVITNLIDNAIEHTPQGGIITLEAKKYLSKVKVSLTDNGEGISPEHLPHIFHRFYRVDESRSRTTGGTGLGLTIAKEIVEVHGGEIWVESEKGTGTTFTFTLPLSKEKKD